MQTLREGSDRLRRNVSIRSWAASDSSADPDRLENAQAEAAPLVSRILDLFVVRIHQIDAGMHSVADSVESPLFFCLLDLRLHQHIVRFGHTARDFQQDISGLFAINRISAARL